MCNKANNHTHAHDYHYGFDYVANIEYHYPKFCLRQTVK